MSLGCGWTSVSVQPQFKLGMRKRVQPENQNNSILVLSLNSIKSGIISKIEAGLNSACRFLALFLSFYFGGKWNDTEFHFAARLREIILSFLLIYAFWKELIFWRRSNFGINCGNFTRQEEWGESAHEIKTNSFIAFMNKNKLI